MFKVKGYFDTGFDIINVPDSVSLLAKCAREIKEYPVLDILQRWFLTSVAIRVAPVENAVAGLDYIEIINEDEVNVYNPFYYVTGYSFTSKDTVTLNIVQDSLLTLGGASRALSGCSIMAKRAHVKKSDDKFGAFCEDDELITPNEQLQMVHAGSTVGSLVGGGGGGVPLDASAMKSNGNLGLFFISPTDVEGTSQTVFVTTAGLSLNNTPENYLNPDLDTNIEYGGKYYVGTAEGAAEVTGKYPIVPPARGAKVTLPHVCFNRNMQPADETNTIYYAGVEYNSTNYDSTSGDEPPYTYHTAMGALQALRSLGMENALIASYRLGLQEGKLTNEVGKLPNGVTGKSFFMITNGGHSGSNIAAETGNPQRWMPGSEPYDYDYIPGNVEIKNKRVLYGQFRSYFIASPATGSSLSAKPEELTKIGKGAPYLFYFSDPRPTGRPYYNFIKFGLDSSPVFNLAEGAIAGGQWPEVPVVFTGMSGEFQARVGYNLSASYQDYLASPERTYRNAVSGAQRDFDTSMKTWAESIPMSIASDGIGVLMGMGNAYAGQSASNAIAELNGTKTQRMSPETSADLSAMSGASGMAGSFMGTLSAGYNSFNSYHNNMAALAEDYNEAVAAGSIGDSMSLASAAWSSRTANAMFERSMAKNYERAQFELSTRYSVPRINFMSTDSMRDITRNALYYARYTPTAKDMKRMDKILDAFGYKVNAIVEGVGRRKNFDYIEGSIEKTSINTVSWYNQWAGYAVGKKEILMDINGQLSAGLRIWHVDPKNKDLDPGD